MVPSTTRDVSSVLSELQPHQVVKSPLSGAYPVPLRIVQLPGAHVLFESRLIRVNLAICIAFGQKVPDGLSNGWTNNNTGLRKHPIASFGPS
ncbi:MAG: hypothetical protein IIC78_14770 [Chloroflexi bacterium]|nr:hypothetical protein [Chloroflexota bacterium]